MILRLVLCRNPTDHHAYKSPVGCCGSLYYSIKRCYHRTLFYGLCPPCPFNGERCRIFSSSYAPCQPAACTPTSSRPRSQNGFGSRVRMSMVSCLHLHALTESSYTAIVVNDYLYIIGGEQYDPNFEKGLQNGKRELPAMDNSS